MHSEPFVLSLDRWATSDELESILKKKGGIRFSTRISEDLAKNRKILKQSWGELQSLIGNLSDCKKHRKKQIERERKAATSLQTFHGIGPKQSRNMLQMLGLARYEIPLDSRVCKWLNKHEIFPFSVNAQLLADQDFYEFILSCIQRVCSEAKVFPCMFDQAVFSSKDRL